MAVVMGKDFRLYYNAGNYSNTNWQAINIVGDVRVPFSVGEADISTRETNFKLTGLGLTDVSVEFDMLYDPADAGFLRLYNAATARTITEEFALADGNVATNGTRYLRSACIVSRFDRDETLDGAGKVSVALKPTRATNGPTWNVVGA
jgi:hypothetical protein